MTEAYEIGITLALQDGVSDGIASIRRDLAALDRAIAATAANLAHLRGAESGTPARAPAATLPRPQPATPTPLPPEASAPAAASPRVPPDAPMPPPTPPDRPATMPSLTVQLAPQAPNSPDSLMRAILEANASVALWLQWLIVLVLGQTRAATSNGADLDTWVADFSLARLPAQAAETAVTFSRITPGLIASIPVGAQVKTADGTQTFAVVTDLTNAAYVPSTTSYTLAAAASSIALTVQAITAGSAGNVQAGLISLLATAMPGVDAVTNPLQAQGGMDAEADAALRARFANFIDSRSRATPTAIAFTIDSLQQGLSHVVTENIDASGNAAPGTFIVTIDDGSGAPPSALISSIATAVDTVRPVGTQFFVLPPTVFTANISLTITVSDANKPASQAAVTSAVQAYVLALTIGAPLPVSRIAALAYAAAANITNVASITINGGGDLIPPSTGVVMPGVIVVN